MTNGEIATELNRFCKCGDLARYRRRIKNYDYNEKLRLAENLAAGDDPEMAIRDAKKEATQQMASGA